MEDFICIKNRKNDDLKCISEENYGEVYKSKWLGLVYGTKEMDVELNRMFIKKVSILASLSHSNLITYYFAIKVSANKSVEYFVIKDKIEYLYIRMELMQIFLFIFINIDIKLQKRCLTCMTCTLHIVV